MIVARNLLLSFAVATSAFAGTYSITTDADSGPGSLRQAILDANSNACAAPCHIQYGANGPLTIQPLSPLPFLTANSVTIEPSLPYQTGTLQINGVNVTTGSGLHVTGAAATITGVVVNGFPGSGIVLDGCGGCRLFANILGLDSTGTRAIPNRQNGVTIIGGSGIGLSQNTIGGNTGNGIYAIGTNAIDSDFDAIGTQQLRQGSNDVLGNGASGVFLQDVKDARFGNDAIANNSIDGIATAGSTTGVTYGGAIYNNGLMPVDLGFDGVTDAGRPLLTIADVSNGFMRVVGTIDHPAGIDVYAGDRVNQFGIADAKTLLYSAKVDAGTFEFRFQLPPGSVGQWISATATANSSTSELSTAIRATVNNQDYNVTNANDSGAGSLRQAILDANAGLCSADFPCRIQFSAAMVVKPSAPLPAITRSGVILDGGGNAEVDATITISSAGGDLAGDTIQNLRIANANGPGIIVDATSNSILNPIISKNTIVNNHGDGILVRGNVPFVHFGTFGSGNRIVRNQIAGNDGNGVTMQGGFFEFDTNTITGNANGVSIEAPAQGHLESNTIAFNRATGVSIAATTAQAFKASIGNMIYANAGDPIRQQPTVQQPPVITSATYDPATKTGTIQGTVTAAGIPGWTTAIDVYASQYPEVGGRGSGEKILLSSYAVNQVGPSFIFTTGADIRGMRLSATATPFIYQGFKTTPDLFGQGFEYGTTSEFSRAIPVVTIGCPADVPRILSGSALPLRWSTVAGATAYNVWARPVPGTPQMIGTTAGDTFTPAVSPGTYEFFVEAIYPQCPSMKSDAVRIGTRLRPVPH